MIWFDKVSFGYGDKQVLTQFDLTILEGERVALCGASGVGKTTALSMLAGLIVPQSGRVDGLPVDGVSMVFQEDRLIPSLTVGENIRVASGETDGAVIEETLARLGLGGESGRYPDELSGGMRRRASLARALLCDRPVYLMDEPFKGLDDATKEQVVALVDERLAGKTLVFVTHDEREAAALGARIVRME